MATSARFFVCGRFYWVRWTVGGARGRKDAREAKNGINGGEAGQKEGAKMLTRQVLGAFLAVFSGFPEHPAGAASWENWAGV